MTCHFYNTTQKILVNGHGYRKLVDIFLKPFFMSKIDSCLKDIQSYNEMLLEKLGHKTVKRSAVRSKVGSPLGCNRCNFASKNMASLKRHKQNEHVISFEASLSLREHPQSTRNNSVVEKMMLEDVSVSDLPNETITLDETTFSYTCEECKYRTKNKSRMNEHVKKEHEPNTNEEVFFTCKECSHDFVGEDDFKSHMCTLSIPLGYGGLIPQGPGGSIPLD